VGTGPATRTGTLVIRFSPDRQVRSIRRTGENNQAADRFICRSSPPAVQAALERRLNNPIDHSATLRIRRAEPPNPKLENKIERSLGTSVSWCPVCPVGHALPSPHPPSSLEVDHVSKAFEHPQAGAAPGDRAQPGSPEFNEPEMRPVLRDHLRLLYCVYHTLLCALALLRLAGPPGRTDR